MHPQRDLSVSHNLAETLEHLQQLCHQQRESYVSVPDTPSTRPSLDVETACWIQSEYEWALKEAAASSLLPYDCDEDVDACPVYDPTFFSTPSSPRQESGCREKPLPPSPPRSPPVVTPPSSPRFTSPSLTRLVSPHLRTPLSSPPVSPQATAFPRSRTPSTSFSSTTSYMVPRSPRQHSTFPSISSTLSLLEERESTPEKRCGVYVTDMDEQKQLSFRDRSGSTSSSMRSRDGQQPASIPPGRGGPAPAPMAFRKPRPNLPMLTTSASSPQLRTLAKLAATPHMSCSLGPSISSPLSPASVKTLRPSPVITEEPFFQSPVVADESRSDALSACGSAVDGRERLTSRWSIDSTLAHHVPRINTNVPPSQSATPSSPKVSKRGRLISIISRARASSVTKNKQAASEEHTGGSPLFAAPVLSSSTNTLSAANRPSIQVATQMSATNYSRGDISTSSSASTLVTPVDEISFMDPFSPTSRSFIPNSTPPSPLSSPSTAAFPSMRSSPTDSPRRKPEDMCMPSPPLPPTVPSITSPTTTSFFLQSRPASFFASLTQRRRQRRQRKLVVSGLPYCDQNVDLGMEPADGAAHDEWVRARDAKRRFEVMYAWCESFGAVSRVERMPDGSLHVHWRNRQVAETVCRVQGQVFIRDVGHVSLTWVYVS